MDIAFQKKALSEVRTSDWLWWQWSLEKVTGNWIHSVKYLYSLWNDFWYWQGSVVAEDASLLFLNSDCLLFFNIILFLLFNLWTERVSYSEKCSKYHSFALLAPPPHLNPSVYFSSKLFSSCTSHVVKESFSKWRLVLPFECHVNL